MDRSADQPLEDALAPANAIPELRVLYVEDEPALARLASRALPVNGIAVQVYTDPQLAALAYEADPEAFDLVVTDQAMSGLTGLELVARLRRTTPDLPVILTSGYLNDAQRATATGLGIAVFLQKPATIADLVAAIIAVGGR